MDNKVIPSKGYIFKTIVHMKMSDLEELRDSLAKQLKEGIVIYPPEIIELVDIYNINNIIYDQKLFEYDEGVKVCVGED